MAGQTEGAQVAAVPAGVQGVQLTAPQGVQVVASRTNTPQVGHQNGPVQCLPTLKCQNCDYITNTQQEMLYHIETQHQQNNIKCDNCPQSFLTSEALVSHIAQAHTGNQHRQRNTLDNGVWTCSFCGVITKGNDARNRHVCSEHRFQTVQQQERRQNRSHKVCKRGEQCHLYGLGKCWYFHAQSVQRNSNAEGPRRSTEKRNMWCAYQDRCNRKQTCTYKHMEEERDFLKEM